ncbi:universal stress protein [Azohydromonas caseinilytica]|uniref:Universal stress protein n=1 Tax=Azohydromonas caseinilytica TaxID=2728836 RepID=A0A848FG18_9BURK|nr:universal stress protein [Azohydromonas caseinilytica]NML18212.1 universal stress protein [Azohydromonas caseinilytica]
MYARILVPVDGSDTAARGLVEAIGLAQALKSTLVLLHVVNDIPMMVEMAPVTSSAEMHASFVKYGQDLLARSSRQAQQAGVRAEAVLQEIVSGRIGTFIAEEAKARDCQLIVMGTHGRRGLSRLTMGSDAELVVRHALVPVLLVRQEGFEP